MKRYIIHVIGKVQGVSFRWSAQREAERLKLQGLARNESDGSVYIEVEGDAARLAEFLSWARRGSGAAIVERVDYTEEKPAGYHEFVIY